jgi:hypothetical protein
VNVRTALSPLSSKIAEGALRNHPSRWTLVGFFALMMGTTGCVARATTGAVVVVDEPVVEVATVPVMIESYPRHYYRGSYVYLVDGQWYYRAHGRWVVYRTEPRALVKVRAGYQAKLGVHYRPNAEVASPAPRPHGKKKGHHKH